MFAFVFNACLSFAALRPENSRPDFYLMENSGNNNESWA